MKKTDEGKTLRGHVLYFPSAAGTDDHKCGFVKQHKFRKTTQNIGMAESLWRL